MKYFAWTTASSPQGSEPSQDVERAVYDSMTEMGLDMPPVRRGWFGGGKQGGAFSSERFPGAFPVWYWEA